MFEHTKAFSGFSADDIPAAKKFYGETLGIPVSEEHGILTLHIAGDRITAMDGLPGPVHVVHRVGQPAGGLQHGVSA